MVSDIKDYDEGDNNHDNSSNDGAPQILDPPHDPLPELTEVVNSNDEEEENDDDCNFLLNKIDLDNDGNLTNQDDRNEEEDEMGQEETVLPEAVLQHCSLQNRKSKKRLTIDFKGRKNHKFDGLIHINPWVVE